MRMGTIPEEPSIKIIQNRDVQIYFLKFSTKIELKKKESTVEGLKLTDSGGSKILRNKTCKCYVIGRHQ